MNFNRLQSSKEFQSNSSRFLNNNNNIEVEKCCSSQAIDDELNEEPPKKANVPIIEDPVDSENENQEISEDEEFVNYEDDDEQLSSPSNSDVDDQRWYAFRGKWMISNVNNQPPLLPLDNQQPRNAQQPQEEEETDFLEMDFEPDTNSEIENEAKGAADYPPINNDFPPQIVFPISQQIPCSSSDITNGRHENHLSRPSDSLNTGAKPKQLSSRNATCNSRHIVNDSKSVFEFRKHEMSSTVGSFSDHKSFSLSSPKTKVSTSFNSDDYNMGASCSYHDTNSVTRTRKSPSKSSIHRQKQERLDEERRNDKFLFEIEPMKPKNSVTIYTTNCDEKICMDTLTSLSISNNEKYRDLISSYFDRSSIVSEQDLVEYLIARSKMNCNHIKLRELFERICSSAEIDDEEKKYEINFYPLDMFSSTPEMIEVEANELVKRWTPLTDLRPLVNIRNKYFYHTNVLGKVVSVIRRINQKPSSTFKENETIRIPQFYPSGYITITPNTCNKFK